ncbi:MAG: hypothetical protein IJ800_04285 [Clostridia bacterium]|nr:hypothetical protein [Clostridia bacterium]
MNGVLILLVVFLLTGSDLKGVTGLLSKIDIPSFAPVLKLIGLNDETINFLCDQKFADALENGLDIKTLIPLFTEFLGKKEKSPDKSQSDITPVINLSPIEEVAPTDIEKDMENYFG